MEVKLKPCPLCSGESFLSQYRSVLEANKYVAKMMILHGEEIGRYRKLLKRYKKNLSSHSKYIREMRARIEELQAE